MSTTLSPTRAARSLSPRHFLALTALGLLAVGGPSPFATDVAHAAGAHSFGAGPMMSAPRTSAGPIANGPSPTLGPHSPSEIISSPPPAHTLSPALPSPSALSFSPATHPASPAASRGLNSVAAPVRAATPAAAPIAASPSSSAAFVNPNTCNPETSTTCAEELLELQQLETSETSLPKLFRQPAPDQLPAPIAEAPLPTNAQDAAASVPLEPLISSSGGPPPGGPPPPPPGGTLAASPGPTQPPTLQFGGGGSTLADCMSIWEPATHMSKSEWRATCVNPMNSIDLPPPAQITRAAPAKPKSTAETNTADDKLRTLTNPPDTLSY